MDRERAAAASQVLPRGLRFANYIVHECIGRGGMARVYRATHEGLHRDIALKVLTAGAVPTTEGHARFLREARLASAVSHPNVVDIFDVGEHDGMPYLAMELLEGQDLDALLRAKGALAESALVEVILPVAAGLIAVHEAGVVHRDLKPENIFLSLDPRGRVVPKLLDFGISRQTRNVLRPTLPLQERLTGTLLYMPPEALLGAEMTTLSDQYSLGVILYEGATGLNPFAAMSPSESTRRIVTGEYPRAENQGIPPSRRLARIIERSMNLDPALRFPDMQSLGRELMRLAKPATQMTSSAAFAKTSPSGRTGTRQRTLVSPTRELGSAVSSSRWPVWLVATSGWLCALVLLLWRFPDEQRPAEPASHDPLQQEGIGTQTLSLRPQAAARIAPDAGVSDDGRHDSEPGAAKAPSRPGPGLPFEPFSPAPSEARPESGGGAGAPLEPHSPSLGTNAAPIFD